MDWRLKVGHGLNRFHNQDSCSLLVFIFAFLALQSLHLIQFREDLNPSFWLRPRAIGFLRPFNFPILLSVGGESSGAGSGVLLNRLRSSWS